MQNSAVSGVGVSAILRRNARLGSLNLWGCRGVKSLDGIEVCTWAR